MQWAVLTLVGIAAVIDIRCRRIPNWLVAPFLIAGVAVNGWASLSGIALAIAIMAPLCFLRAMGMGDLKLCAAIGAWIGSSQLVVALVFTALAGGVIALVWAGWRGELGASLDGAGDLVAGRGLQNQFARTLPYAPAIAIGTWFSFFCR
jgi:prepilin peptidase CpaA